MPIVCNDGMASIVNPHFARAPMHAVVNNDDCSISIIASNEGDSGKKRIPLDAMKAQGVELVICRRIGRHAFETLKTNGIDVLITKASTIREAIMEMDSGKLEAPSEEILSHEGVMKHNHEHCGEHGEECNHGEEAEGHRCCESSGEQPQEHERCCHRHGNGHKCCHSSE